MHEIETRINRCRSMFQLWQSVARVLEVIHPFPGTSVVSHTCEQRLDAAPIGLMLQRGDDGLEL